MALEKCVTDGIARKVNFDKFEFEAKLFQKLSSQRNETCTCVDIDIFEQDPVKIENDGKKKTFVRPFKNLRVVSRTESHGRKKISCDFLISHSFSFLRFLALSLYSAHFFVISESARTIRMALLISGSEKQEKYHEILTIICGSECENFRKIL